MIDSANDEDRRVRREALTALRQLTDDPAIRAVLESVVANEPNLALELGLPELLAERRAQ